MYKISVIQGDSKDLEFMVRPIQSLSDFTCQLQVRDSGGVIQVDRAIETYNTANTGFRARLLPVETLALPIGVYNLSAQIYNSTTLQSVEIQVELTITTQYNY